MRTITDIMQNAVSTYLGMPLLVNFGTEANNYQDADEVGAVIWRAWHDVKEKALRMYPWSFARRDGVIVGTKAADPSYEHFPHFANINDFLFKVIPSSATVEQTTGTSLTRLNIDVTLFEKALQEGMTTIDPDSYTYENLQDLLNDGGTVTFTCTDVNMSGASTWAIIGTDATISVPHIREYGITWYKRDTPVVDDVLTVTYVSTLKVEDYVCIQAAFFDPRHWAKCFDWKQFGTDTIKFAPAKLYVEYTFDVDVDDYPAYFVDYLSCALAVECCAPLRVESKLPMLVQQLTAVYLDARKQDSMGEPSPASFDNIIDEARNAL